MTEPGAKNSVRRSVETPQHADGEFSLLAPTFVELSEDQAERAVSALAELLAAVVDRSGAEVEGVPP